MSARFEIVRTDAEQPWHARFRAANGRVVWTTENYARRRGALRAVESMVAPFTGSWVDRWWDFDLGRIVDAVIYRSNHWEKTNARRLEIRDVDERTP